TVGAGVAGVAEHAGSEAHLPPAERPAGDGTVGEHGQLAAGEARAAVARRGAHRQAQGTAPRVRHRHRVARGRAAEFDARLVGATAAANARAGAQAAAELARAARSAVGGRGGAHTREAGAALRIEPAAPARI